MMTPVTNAFCQQSGLFLDVVIMFLALTAVFYAGLMLVGTVWLARVTVRQFRIVQKRIENVQKEVGNGKGV